jgi:hypothetical protein
MYRIAFALEARTSAQNSRRENLRANIIVPDVEKVAGKAANLSITNVGINSSEKESKVTYVAVP